jgi:hypothetical protein
MNANAAVRGALVTAAVSTIGDYLWANVLPHGIPIYGFAHGAILFFTVGACLGLPSRKPVLGGFGGMAIGIGATAGFYALRPLLGYSGLFVMFVALWIGLALLAGRVLQTRDSRPSVLVRGTLAAIGSGIGFYIVAKMIWLPFNPQNSDYPKHFVLWTLAYLPGFAALLMQINLSSLRR